MRHFVAAAAAYVLNRVLISSAIGMPLGKQQLGGSVRMVPRVV